jgi:hypothetical protein
MAKKRITAKAQNQALDNLAKHLVSGQATKGHMPSTDSLRRLTALPLLFEASEPKSPRSGRIQFDSWADGGVALRDATAGHIRRMRLTAGSVGLDVVAERQFEGWQFTARAYHDGRVSHDFVLKVGGSKYAPQSGGYYQWRTKGVPSHLELGSVKDRIVFEQIAWR